MCDYKWKLDNKTNRCDNKWQHKTNENFLHIDECDYKWKSDNNLINMCDKIRVMKILPNIDVIINDHMRTMRIF